MPTIGLWVIRCLTRNIQFMCQIPTQKSAIRECNPISTLSYDSLYSWWDIGSVKLLQYASLDPTRHNLVAESGSTQANSVFSFHRWPKSHQLAAAEYKSNLSLCPTVYDTHNDIETSCCDIGAMIPSHTILVVLKVGHAVVNTYHRRLLELNTPKIKTLDGQDMEIKHIIMDA